MIYLILSGYFCVMKSLTKYRLFPENRRRMALLELLLIFMLQFEAGSSGEHNHLYHRPGHDATLSCGSKSSFDTPCSIIDWLYNREQSKTLVEVKNGNVKRSSPRAARLSLDTNCSLAIKNITAEDVGSYTCRQGNNNSLDVDIYLSVLTISPSQPDADPQRRDDEVKLECSLLIYRDLGSFPKNRMRWVDETGTVLRGEDVLGQMNCVSVLTVKLQSANNRRYTCQLLDEENNVEVEADYTPVFRGGIRDDQQEKSNSDSTDWSPLSCFMMALRIGGLILMIIITVLVIRNTRNTKPLDDDNKVHNDGDEVNYENVEARPATTRLH